MMKNTNNIFDITKHDDAVYPYYVEVNPNELKRNVRSIIEESKKLHLLYPEPE